MSHVCVGVLCGWPVSDIPEPESCGRWRQEGVGRPNILHVKSA